MANGKWQMAPINIEGGFSLVSKLLFSFFDRDAKALKSASGKFTGRVTNESNNGCANP